MGDLPEERLLCPVRAVRMYLDTTAFWAPRPRSLFVSPHLSRSLSKNALSYFLRLVVFFSAGAMQGDLISLPQAYSIRRVATSAAFWHHWSVSKVLEAATWRSTPVFALFYPCVLSFTLDICHSLGPFVAAGSVVQWFFFFFFFFFCLALFRFAIPTLSPMVILLIIS